MLTQQKITLLLHHFQFYVTCPAIKSLQCIFIFPSMLFLNFCYVLPSFLSSFLFENVYWDIFFIHFSNVYLLRCAVHLLMYLPWHLCVISWQISLLIILSWVFLLERYHLYCYICLSLCMLLHHTSIWM